MLTLSFVFINCGEESGENIVGTWECKMTRAELAAMMSEESEDGTVYNDALLIILGIPESFVSAELVCSGSSDSGTVTFYSFNPKDGTKEETYSGTYKVNGNKVTFTTNDGSHAGTISGDELTLTETGRTMVFTRK